MDTEPSFLRKQVSVYSGKKGAFNRICFFGGLKLVLYWTSFISADQIELPSGLEGQQILFVSHLKDRGEGRIIGVN